MRALAILLIAPALLATACASQPGPKPALDETEVSRQCLRETGTRLAVPEGKCVAGRGRVITREDLERSGAMTTGEAVRHLR